MEDTKQTDCSGPAAGQPNVRIPGVFESLLRVGVFAGAIGVLIWWNFGDSEEGDPETYVPQKTAAERAADDAKWACVDRYLSETRNMVELHDAFARQSGDGYDVHISAYLRELDFSATCRVENGVVVEFEFIGRN